MHAWVVAECPTVRHIIGVEVGVAAVGGQIEAASALLLVGSEENRVGLGNAVVQHDLGVCELQARCSTSCQSALIAGNAEIPPEVWWSGPTLTASVVSRGESVAAAWPVPAGIATAARQATSRATPAPRASRPHADHHHDPAFPRAPPAVVKASLRPSPGRRRPNSRKSLRGVGLPLQVVRATAARHPCPRPSGRSAAPSGDALSGRIGFGKGIACENVAADLVGVLEGVEDGL